MTDVIALVVAITALVGLVPAILAGVAALRWSKAQQAELDRHRIDLAACRKAEFELRARLSVLERKLTGDTPPSGQRPATGL